MLEENPETVRLVFKHFPLRNHKFAYKAALAAMAAGTRGLFWEFHDRLFQNYNRLSDPVLKNIRKELNLLDPAFDEAMKSPQIVGLIRRDFDEGRQAGVRGTPTLFINGKRFEGRRNLEGFREAIQNELKKQNAK